MPIWIEVTIDSPSFDIRDLLGDEGVRIYDHVEEYDLEHHANNTDSFVADFGYGESTYRWVFYIVHRLNLNTKELEETRYVFAQLWPSVDDLAELYKPNCQCDYCTSSWFSWTWIFWRPDTHCCLKSEFGWMNVGNVREKTRDYLVRKFKTSVYKGDGHQKVEAMPELKLDKPIYRIGDMIQKPEVV